MQKKLEQLKYVMQFFPLRLNFFVFSLLMFIIYQFSQQSTVETSSFHHFLMLMSKIGFWILALTLTISLLTVAAACLYFIRHRNYFNVRIHKKESEAEHNILVETSIDKIVRPVLGNIGVRYLYNKNQLSPAFILKNRQTVFSLLPLISHRSTIDLPNVKEYNLEAALLSFQDLFRFFSFTFKNSIQSQFINLPYEIETSKTEVEPKTTQTDEVRTNTLRKIQGEWLEYKKYEATDDIRRIVWKVFAKNKELIVRKQEVLSPYATNINCYVSFYSEYSFSQNCSDAMSDFYKNYVWSFFKELSSNELEVKLQFDQFQTGVTDSALIAEQIAQANWQSVLPASKFCDTQKGSVVFLQSLIPTNEIEKVLDGCGKNILVVYVDLTAVFASTSKMPLWKRIFLKPKNQRNEELYINWKTSPSRLLINKEIEKHKKLLENTLAQVEIIA